MLPGRTNCIIINFLSLVTNRLLSFTLIFISRLDFACLLIICQAICKIQGIQGLQFLMDLKIRFSSWRVRANIILNPKKIHRYVTDLIRNDCKHLLRNETFSEIIFKNFCYNNQVTSKIKGSQELSSKEFYFTF